MPWSRAEEDAADDRVCMMSRLLDEGICAEVGVTECVGVNAAVVVIAVVVVCEVGEPRRDDVECGVRLVWTAACVFDVAGAVSDDVADAVAVAGEVADTSIGRFSGEWGRESGARHRAWRCGDSGVSPIPVIGLSSARACQACEGRDGLVSGTGVGPWPGLGLGAAGRTDCDPARELAVEADAEGAQSRASLANARMSSSVSTGWFGTG
jgi:hypothetical protein